MNRKKLSGLVSRLETIKKMVEIHMANIAKLTQAYLIFLQGPVKLYSTMSYYVSVCYRPILIIQKTHKNTNQTQNPSCEGFYADICSILRLAPKKTLTYLIHSKFYLKSQPQIWINPWLKDFDRRGFRLSDIISKQPQLILGILSSSYRPLYNAHVL